MATAAGNLVVNLMARTGQFEQGMKRSAQHTTMMRASVQKLGRSLQWLGGTFLGVAGAAGAMALIKRNLELMDSTAKLSDRLGIATEQLQGLRHAAELTGAGAGVLDSSLERMQRSIGQAATGSGAAAKTLEELGLPIQSLLRMDAGAQFHAIADAIASIESPAQRAAAAADIFGRGSTVLLNTLAEGSAGLRAMEQEAERLGKTFSRETAAQAEAANDAITRLKAGLAGAATTITGDLAPAIAALAEGMAELPRMFSETQLAVARFILWNEQKKGDWWGWMGDWEPGGDSRKIYIEELERTIADLERTVERRRGAGASNVPGGTSPAATSTATAGPWTGGTDTASAMVAALQRMLGGAAGEFRRPEREWTDPFTGAAVGSADAGGALARMLGTDLARGAGEALRTTMQRLDLYREMQPMAEQLRRSLETPAEAFERRLKEIDRMAEAGAIDAETQVRALEKLRDEFTEDSPGGSTRFAGAMEKGSAEAFSAILASMGQGRDEPARKTAENTKVSAERLKEVKDQINQLVALERDRQEVEIPPA